LTTAWLNQAAVLMLLGDRQQALRTIRQAADAGAISHLLAESYRKGIRSRMLIRQLMQRLLARCAAFSTPPERPPVRTRGWQRKLTKPFGLLRTATYRALIQSGQPPAA